MEGNEVTNNTCYLCGEKAVVWDISIEGSDVGIDLTGIFHKFHCMNCGAEISVYKEEQENEVI